MRLATRLALCAVLLGATPVPPAAAPRAPVAGVVKADLRQAQTLVNQWRRSHGLAPLAIDSSLTAAAQAHSNDMARHDTMSHTVSYGSLPRRMASAGLHPMIAAENVSAGYKSTTRAIDGWKKSPGHNRNLLLSRATHMGFAVAYQPNSRYRTYWTLILAGQ